MSEIPQTTVVCVREAILVAVQAASFPRHKAIHNTAMRVICLLALAIIAVSASSDPCSSYSDCQSCVSYTSSGYTTECGWCTASSSCMAGDASGPFGSGTCASDWQYASSQVLTKTNGAPVHPSAYDVFLAPGDPLDVTIDVTVPQSESQPLDVYIAEDSSGSFVDDMATFRALVPDLILNLLLYQPDTQFGLGSFIEKPTSKVDGDFVWPTPTATYEVVSSTSGPGKADGNTIGFFDPDARAICPARPNGGDCCNEGPLNWNFCNEFLLSNDYNGMQLAVDGLVNNGNRDYPENALEAVMFATVCDMGWRPEAKKVIIAATDAKFHYYNDRELEGSNDWYTLTPDPPMNNYDCVKDEFATGWLPGVGEDYPTKQGVADLLSQNNIIPIWLVAENGDDDTGPHAAWYQNIISEFGFGYYRELASDSSDLVDLIISVLDETSETVELLTTSDAAGIVDSFTPPQYTGVAAGSKVTFTVTLLISTPLAQDETVVMTAVGYGTTTITVFSAFPCLGCDGVPNSGMIFDRCGVCGGNDACVGCDDVPFSGLTYDVCNVCGGDGTSCLGCDGVPFSGCEYDICGVCCGDNSTCSNDTTVAEPIPPVEAELTAGAKAGISIAAISAAAAFAGAGYLAFSSRSEYIKVEEELAAATDGVKDNPLYNAKSQWKTNAIAD